MCLRFWSRPSLHPRQLPEGGSGQGDKPGGKGLRGQEGPPGQIVPKGRPVQPVKGHIQEGHLVAAVLRAVTDRVEGNPGPEAVQGVPQIRPAVGGQIPLIQPHFPAAE